MSVASRTIFVQYDGMKDSALIQFKLMLPAELKARVDHHATANRRSLSQEIVAALEVAYPAPAVQNFTIADIQEYLSDLPEDEREAQLQALFKSLERQKPSPEKKGEADAKSSTRKRA